MNRSTMPNLRPVPEVSGTESPLAQQPRVYTSPALPEMRMFWYTFLAALVPPVMRRAFPSICGAAEVPAATLVSEEAQAELKRQPKVGQLLQVPVRKSPFSMML